MATLGEAQFGISYSGSTKYKNSWEIAVVDIKFEDVGTETSAKLVESAAQEATQYPAFLKGVFGVDEALWNTLSAQERERVIEGFNKRKEMELVNRQKREEKELENQRHRQTDVGRRTLVVGSTELEISPFPGMSEAWVKGQRAKLRKNDESLMYPIQIENLDNGETVSGKKARTKA